MCKLPMWTRCGGFVGRIAAGGDPTSTEHTASTVRLDFIATIGVGGAGGTMVGGTDGEREG